MAYAPIGSYGLIGNMRTAALISRDGAIEWMCLPHFDSPSVFGALLDRARGGHFTISPDDGTVNEAGHPQYYWPETNVLMTHIRTDGGAAEVLDFMPVGMPKRGHHTPDLVRLVRPVHGTTKLRVEVAPAFDYGRRGHEVHMHRLGAVFTSGEEGLAVSSTCRLTIDGGVLRGGFEVSEGNLAAFALWHRGTKEHWEPLEISAERADELLEHTLTYWRGWIARSTYTGRWQELVNRSALALKLLTFEPTGAIVAAPTTSLPERIGGTRNWDYRYTWLRDAAFTIYALLRLGYTTEATAFFGWLEQRCHELEPGRMLRPVYGIHGAHELPEQTLDHWEGYRASRPVRIGNAAAEQLQLDAYGALMDAVYLHNKHAMPITYDLWQELRSLANWMCEHWQEPDQGIWEVRSGPKHFVYSKLMCWVTLDRAVRLAESRSFPAERDRWRTERDKLHEQIMRQGWSTKRRAFVQHFESESLDAANLLMSQVLFLGPTDPRLLSTIDAIASAPGEGGLLEDFVVYRYDYNRTDDGLREPEGGFNMCTYWLIEALTRAGKAEPQRLEQARLLFERMLACASPLGLFSEQTAPSGQPLGNFPQALTHLSFITAAMGLDQALSRG